jgi:hypothetical protein
MWVALLQKARNKGYFRPEKARKRMQKDKKAM